MNSPRSNIKRRRMIPEAGKQVLDMRAHDVRICVNAVRVRRSN
jgi:hypothetical protein